MKIALMQPYLFPYLGYYQLASAVDRFVFFDDVNFIVRGWINRNRILVGGQPRYFTVPLQGASQNSLIKDVEVSVGDPRWQRSLLSTIRQTYARAPQVGEVLPLVEEVVCNSGRRISDMASRSVMLVFEYLGLPSRWRVSSHANYGNDHLRGQDRVIDICLKENASCYVNPPNGKPLYHGPDFCRAGIELMFLSPVLDPYPQNAAMFVPGLSMIDVLMNLPRAEVRGHLSRHLIEAADSSVPGTPDRSAHPAGCWKAHVAGQQRSEGDSMPRDNIENK